MANISDISSRLSQQFLLQVLRGKMDEAQRQTSSGKKSTNIAGLGPSGTSRAISLRNNSALLDTYTSNLNNAKSRLTVIDNALGSITESARDLLATLREQVQGTVPKAAIISDAANSSLQNVMDKLNTQFNGRYLFAGDDIYNKPIDNPSALDTNTTALVTGWLSGGTTAANVVTASQTVANTGLGISNGTLISGSVVVRADDNVDVDLTLKPSQSGFADIMRAMSIISNLPQPTTSAEQVTYWNIVNGAIKLLDNGVTAVDQTQGIMGSRAKTVESLISQHADTKTAYEQSISDIEDVDAAEAAVRMQRLQTQLQTSYSVIASLKDLSLVNYIR